MTTNDNNGSAFEHIPYISMQSELRSREPATWTRYANMPHSVDDSDLYWSVTNKKERSHRSVGREADVMQLLTFSPLPMQEEY